MSADYPPTTAFTFNGRLTVLTVTPTAPPVYDITGLYASDGAFMVGGISFSSTDLPLGPNTNAFISDFAGRRYRVTNVTSNLAVMSLTILDIDSYAVGPSTGSGTIYLATSNSNITLTGVSTVSGLSESLQQGLRSRAMNELDSLLGNTGLIDITTTDATPTTAATIVTNPDRTYLVDAEVTARRTDSGSESLVGKINGAWRNNSTVLSRVGGGSIDDSLIFEDVASWDFATSAPAATALTGTVSGTIATVALTGVGTLFLTELAVGDWIQTDPAGVGDIRQVATITDNLNLTVTAAWSATVVGVFANLQGTNVLVQVTGAGGSTVDWKVRVRVTESE